MFKKIVHKLLQSVNSNTKKEIDSSKILTGRSIANFNAAKTTTKLAEVEFKVFSQWGDDGIIQYLIATIDIPTTSEIFIEFGVEDYTESNTRFLLINNNWRGLVIDGSVANIDHVKKDSIYWKHHLSATAAFITKDNINNLIKDAGITGEIGILSIDIDGNDYWIWQKIEAIDPIIVIVEYNSIFGKDKPFTVIYQDDFERSNNHYSNLLYGTSLLSICDLAKEKGYEFIGCNSAGNNSYFIRKDKMKHFKPLSCEEGFIDAKFRESRDRSGQLSLLTDADKYKEIKGSKIYNTRTNQIEIL